MYRICFREIQDEHVAANMVQNVFLSIWERRHSLVLENPERFLMHAAKLQIIKFFRDSASRKLHFESSLIDFAEEDTSTEQTIYYNDLALRINGLVDQLPKQCRNVYRMRDQQGLKNSEIAVALEISVSAVKQHIGNALSFLRKNLEK